MAIIHKKTWPELFEQVRTEKKKFDVRVADFAVQPGDVLVLEEWDPNTQSYTGRSIEVIATYILKTKEQTFWPAEDVERYGLQIIQFEPKNNT